MIRRVLRHSVGFAVWAGVFGVTISWTLVSAEPVDVSTAQRVGANFAQTEHRRAAAREAMEAQQAAPVSAEPVALTDPDTRQTVAYVVPLNPGGFVVTSADTDITPVVVVSLTGTFPFQEHPENHLLYMVRTDMALRLQARAETPAAQLAANRAEWQTLLAGGGGDAASGTDGQTWGPFLTTSWNQSGFYNDYCPDDPRTEPGLHTDDGRCVTGCVATAMGQIINYWKHPSSVTFTAADDYTSRNDPGDGRGERVIPISAATANIPSIVYTSISNDTIARLLYACGVSVRMNYSDAGSAASTSSVGEVLKAKWSYPSGAWVSSTDSGLYTLLSANMRKYAPCQLSIGTSMSGSGHSIVCDGYRDSDGRYHLNFGWSGSSDGWYSLPSGMPAGYSVVRGAVLDIAPPLPPVIVDRSTRKAFEGRTYSERPTLLQGTPPITWALVAGPSGMTIDPNIGVVRWSDPGPVGSEHSVTVRATNALGSDEATWTVRVYKQTKRFAVLAGVSDYMIIDGLSYCDDDVRDLRDALIKDPGWDPNNIAVLIDRDASKAGIRSAIEAMGAKAGPDDQCLFFFSGHGSYTSDRPPLDETDGYDETICPYDTSPADPNSEIRDDELGDWIGALPTRNVIVILDTCYSGGAIKAPLPEGAAIKTINPDGPPPAPGDGFAADLKAIRGVDKDVDDVTGVVVLTACDDWELSSESSQLKNGVFTYYLLDAISNANADTSRNGMLSAEEAHRYLLPLVLTQTYAWQTPQLYDGNGTAEAEFTLSAYQAPIIIPIPDRSVRTGQSYTESPKLLYGITPVMWSLAAGPDGMTVNSTNGKVTWAEPGPVDSVHTVTLLAQNEIGVGEMTWTVYVQTPPIIAAIPDQSIMIGQPYTYTPTLTSGSPPVTWSMVLPPAGMTIDPNSGQINWPQPTSNGSPFTLKVRATNGVGSNEASWTLSVKAAPSIASMADEPNVPVGAYYTRTLRLLEGSPTITWTKVSGPGGLEINAVRGVVSWPKPGPPDTVHEVRVRAENDVGSHEIAWRIGVVLPPGKPVIDAIANQTAIVGQPFALQPILKQGTKPITWSLVEPHACPAGLTIDPNSGAVNWPNPGLMGDVYTITIRAANSEGFSDLSWQVSVVPPMGPPKIAAISDRALLVGANYVEHVRLDQGTLPVQWSLVSGPARMTIDPNGVVRWSGATQTGSPFTVTVRASNDEGQDQTSWLVRVMTAPVIAPVANKVAVVGQPYTDPLQLSQGGLPVTWSLVSAPAGMTIDATSGTVTWSNPVAAGSPFTVIARATNDVGWSDASWQVSVKAPPIIRTIQDQTVTAGLQYAFTPMLEQGTAPVTWSLVVRPTGMTVNSNSGAVTWPLPIVTGSPHSITLRARNAQGQHERTWLLTVTEPPMAPEIRDIPDQTLELNQPYVGPEVVLTQGTRPVTWSLVRGPAGMTVDPATGAVAWSAPTTVGSPFLVCIRAENAVGGAEKTWRVTVKPPMAETTLGVTPTDVGLRFVVDGQSYYGVQKFNWQAGGAHQLSVPTPQFGTDGLRYTFESWSDGGGTADRTLVVGSAGTLTARMRGLSITDMTITGPASVQANAVGQYRCEATWNTGAKGDVTSEVQWRVSSDTAATIGAGGVLTARNVPADCPCEIIAAYAKDGISKSVRMTVTILKVSQTCTLTVGTSPAGATAPVRSIHNRGEQVSVFVPEPPQDGMTFVGWSGAGSGTSNPLVLTLNGDTEVVAVFTKSSDGSSGSLVPSTCGVGASFALACCLGGMLILGGTRPRSRRVHRDA